MANRRVVPLRPGDDNIAWLSDAAVGGLGLDFDLVPAELGDGPATTEWRRLGAEFVGRDEPRFREGDRAVLAAYCIAYAVFLQASQHLMEEGLLVDGRSSPDRERRVKSPAMVVWTQASTQLRQLARELGLTPDARGRMGLREPTEPAGDDDAGNPFAGGGS